MDIPGRGNVDLSDVAQSYGGTIYGTTPGGTRIVYTRDMLMNCRTSPLAKTPPPAMPEIPGVTIGTPYVPEVNPFLKASYQVFGKHVGVLQDG